MGDRYGIAEFCFESRVKILASANCDKAVGVGELGEDTDLVRVLKLGPGSHDLVGMVSVVVSVYVAMSLQNFISSAMGPGDGGLSRLASSVE